MVIDGYSIGGYSCLLMAIILMVIGGYFINGYWWLFRCKHWWLLMAILMVINGYCIISYCWLLYVILQLLVIIVL
jgi:hypothetical protein